MPIRMLKSFPAILLVLVAALVLPTPCAAPRSPSQALGIPRR